MSDEWLSKEALMKLMEEPTMEKLERFGGIQGIMRSLKSSEHGISASDLREAERQEKFALIRPCL